jgi:histidyl-tRNA synthetase
LQADAELCVMISEILEKCGLEKKEYIVKISSRKIMIRKFKKHG